MYNSMSWISWVFNLRLFQLFRVVTDFIYIYFFNGKLIFKVKIVSVFVNSLQSVFSILYLSINGKIFKGPVSRGLSFHQDHDGD
jgi:hypothetical protein